MTDLEEFFRESEGATEQDLKESLNGVMRHLRIKVLALIKYSMGMCQSKEAQKIAKNIENRAISRGSIGDNPEELLADEAVYDKEILSLEQQVEADMQNRSKPVRQQKTHLADMFRQKSILEEALRNVA